MQGVRDSGRGGRVAGRTGADAFGRNPVIPCACRNLELDLVVHFGPGMKIQHLVTAALATLAAACGNPAAAPETEAPFARPSGYWEGKGTLEKTDLKDDFRDMQRSAEFTFWFVMDKAGVVEGEIEVVYDATLTVKNLPEIAVATPWFGGNFQPKVGGMVTDPNPRRRFRLYGQYDGALTLNIGGLEAAKPIQFTVRADAGLGGGLNTPGGNGMSIERVREADSTVMEMPMKPYSPFIEPANVQKRPNGPHAARYEVNDPDLAIYWTATQINTREERR